MPRAAAVEEGAREAADAVLAAQLQAAFAGGPGSRPRRSVAAPTEQVVRAARRAAARAACTELSLQHSVPHRCAPAPPQPAYTPRGAAHVVEGQLEAPTLEGEGALEEQIAGGGPLLVVKPQRPPRRPEYQPGALVWATVPGISALRWPGRIWLLKHTRRRRELAECRVNLSRLVNLLGDGSFAWALDSDLMPHDDGPAASAAAAALAAYGAARKGSSRLGAQARRASRQLAEAPLEAFDPPWTPGEDSEAEEAADEAAAAAATAAGSIAADAATVHAALAETAVRDGLTPDWIIDAGCDIFGLRRPTMSQPLIAGLCDPCCNNKRNPNIPAERLFCKADDGLKVSNSWAEKYIILNPPYEAQTQWRFINRAINEVEWGRVPGILIVCRNSTDTAYFQRLRPFPRCMLRRDAIIFKDYPDKSPPAFGICSFLLTKSAEHQSLFYPRFVDAFAGHGEVCMPIDSLFARQPQFTQLVQRLAAQSVQSQRDSWVCCDACGRWRALPAGSDADALACPEVAWTCASAHPLTGCEEPLSRREMRAFIYKTEEADAEDQFPVHGHEHSRALAAAEGRSGDVAAAAAQQHQQREDEALARALHEGERRRSGLRSGGAEEENADHAALPSLTLALEPLSPPPVSTTARKRPREPAAPPLTFPDAVSAHEDASSLTEYERARLERMAENRERLCQLLRDESALQAADRRETAAAAAAAVARRARDNAEQAAAAAASEAARAASLAAQASAAAQAAAMRAAAAAALRETALAVAQLARQDLARAAEKHVAATREGKEARAAAQREAETIQVEEPITSEQLSILSLPQQSCQSLEC